MLTVGVIGRALSIAAIGALTVIGTGTAGTAGTARTGCYWSTNPDGVPEYKCPVESPGKRPGNPQDSGKPHSDPGDREALNKLCSELANRGEPLPPACTVGRPTPAQLLQRALKVLNPPFPRPETAPPRGADSAVGVAVWVWVDAATWKPITKRATAGPVWAQVTAKPVRLVLRPGDGGEESCQGPGVPWSARDVGGRPCTHRYLRSSAHQPNSAFSMTVTVVWQATWTSSANPTTPTPLPDIARSATLPVRVAEGQALN